MSIPALDFQAATSINSIVEAGVGTGSPSSFNSLTTSLTFNVHHSM
jgi:hypothetical protein